MNRKLTATLTAAATLAAATILVPIFVPSHPAQSDEPAPPKEGAPPPAADKPAPPAAAQPGEKAAPGSTPAAAAEEPKEPKEPPQDPALGAIVGRIVLEGAPPDLAAVAVPPNNPNHKDCAAHVKDERVVLGKAKEVKNAIVSIAGYKPAERPQPRPVTLDNKNCAFVPHIQATTVGSTLKVTSSDPFLHNTHGYLAVNFNTAISKGDTVEKKLPKEGKILISCDYHPWMQAWIWVFGHDLFAASAADGTYKLVNVPPGEHEIEVWHEVLESPKQKVKVEAGKAATVDFVVRSKKKSTSGSGS